MGRAFRALVEDVEDLSLDCPNASDFLGRFIARALVAGILALNATLTVHRLMRFSLRLF